MIPMRNVSAALLLALVAVAPLSQAMAAADTAKMMPGAKTEAVPVGNLTGMIGSWKPTDLASLDKATTIKVFDTHAVYGSADLKKIATAESSKSAQLGKLHDAIRGDANLKAWFDANKIDVNKVIAVSEPKGGQPELFTY